MMIRAVQSVADTVKGEEGVREAGNGRDDLSRPGISRLTRSDHILRERMMWGDPYMVADKCIALTPH